MAAAPARPGPGAPVKVGLGTGGRHRTRLTAAPDRTRAPEPPGPAAIFAEMRDALLERANIARGHHLGERGEDVVAPAVDEGSAAEDELEVVAAALGEFVELLNKSAAEEDDGLVAGVGGAAVEGGGELSAGEA